jgi:hypothetical protein
MNIVGSGITDSPISTLTGAVSSVKELVQLTAIEPLSLAAVSLLFKLLAAPIEISAIAPVIALIGGS